MSTYGGVSYSSLTTLLRLMDQFNIDKSSPKHVQEFCGVLSDLYEVKDSPPVKTALRQLQEERLKTRVRAARVALEQAEAELGVLWKR